MATQGSYCKNRKPKTQTSGGCRGQILIGVILILALMTIMIPALVYWSQQDVRGNHTGEYRIRVTVGKRR